MPSKTVRACGPAHPPVAKSRRSSTGGWTMTEMLLVVAIVGLIIKISIPTIQNTILAFNLSTAGSTVAGAIQQNRYQAIMIGCPYSVAFTAGSTTYQVQPQSPSGTPLVCTNGSAKVISWTGAGGISLVTSTTFTFLANGTVSATQGASNCTMPCSFQLSDTQGSTNTISVSGVGYVKVTSP